MTQNGKLYIVVFFRIINFKMVAENTARNIKYSSTDNFRLIEGGSKTAVRSEADLVDVNYRSGAAVGSLDSVVGGESLMYGVKAKSGVSDEYVAEVSVDNEKSLDGILDGVNTTCKYGEGVMTAYFKDGTSLGIHDAGNRVEAYFRKAEDLGVELSGEDYVKVADFVLGNKYSAGNAERQGKDVAKIMGFVDEENVEMVGNYFNAAFEKEAVLGGLEGKSGEGRSVGSNGGDDGGDDGSFFTYANNSMVGKIFKGATSLLTTVAVGAGAVSLGTAVFASDVKADDLGQIGGTDFRDYEVDVDGQTPEDIAERYEGVSGEDIRSANSQTFKGVVINSLEAGEHILIPSKVGPVSLEKKVLTGSVNTSISGDVEGRSVYTIQKGDTMSEIGTAHGGFSKLNVFYGMNPQIENKDLIYPGQTVNVTAKAKEILESKGGAIAKALIAGAAADKLAADKLAADKLAADKLAADKLAADKLAADKLAADKLAAEKRAGGDVLVWNDGRDEESEELMYKAAVAEEARVGNQMPTSSVSASEGMGLSDWNPLKYVDYMESVSPILDGDGRAVHESGKFGDAVLENYRAFSDAANLDGLGFSAEDTKGRFVGAGDSVVDAGKNLANFLTLGQMCQPDHLKEGGANKVLSAVGAPFRAVGDLFGGLVKVLDIPTGGATSKVLGLTTGAVSGTVGTLADTVTYGVGTATVPLQNLEESKYGEAHVSKAINVTVGVAARLLENIVTMDGLTDADLGDKGVNKGTVGTLLEQFGSYALIVDSMSPDEDVIVEDSIGDPIVPIIDDTITGGQTGVPGMY
jgi:hypothetical protein